jgi:hypothetical protein
MYVSYGRIDLSSIRRPAGYDSLTVKINNAELIHANFRECIQFLPGLVCFVCTGFPEGRAVVQDFENMVEVSHARSLFIP